LSSRERLILRCRSCHKSKTGCRNYYIFRLFRAGTGNGNHLLITSIIVSPKHFNTHRITYSLSAYHIVQLSISLCIAHSFCLDSSILHSIENISPFLLRRFLATMVPPWILPFFAGLTAAINDLASATYTNQVVPGSTAITSDGCSNLALIPSTWT